MSRTSELSKMSMAQLEKRREMLVRSVTALELEIEDVTAELAELAIDLKTDREELKAVEAEIVATECCV